jgi:hypothetical protein
MNDEIWTLMNACWDGDWSRRPHISDILTRMKQAHLTFLNSLPAVVADFGETFERESPVILDSPSHNDTKDTSSHDSSSDEEMESSVAQGNLNIAYMQ